MELVRTKTLALVLGVDKKTVLEKARKGGWAYVEKSGGMQFVEGRLPSDIRFALAAYRAGQPVARQSEQKELSEASSRKLAGGEVFLNAGEKAQDTARRPGQHRDPLRLRGLQRRAVLPGPFCTARRGLSDNILPMAFELEEARSKRSDTEIRTYPRGSRREPFRGGKGASPAVLAEEYSAVGTARMDPHEGMPSVEQMHLPDGEQILEQHPKDDSGLLAAGCGKVREPFPSAHGAGHREVQVA